jgi:catechol 2,3-dioxygenase-like lactoylglutathione lyase family enzyme
MKLKYICSLLFVENVKRSTEFYRDILGQEVEHDFGENVSFIGGFSIQKVDHISKIIFGNETRQEYKLGGDNLELYFESENIDGFQKYLKEKGIEFIHDVREMPWAQKAMRIRDPDGYIIEIGEPLPLTMKRLKDGGLTEEQLSERVGVPIEGVKFMLNSL